MVNDLRRKIKNEKLAKRVKQLVRNWKKILDQTATPNGSPGGVHIAAHLAASPAVSPALAHPSPQSRLASPALARTKPGTPKGLSPALAPQRVASPALAGKKGLSPAAAHVSAVAGRKGLSPAMSASPALVGKKGLSPALAGSRPTTPNAVNTKVSSPRGFLTSTPSGRLASPALSGRAVSPVGKVPSLSGRVASPALASSQPSPLASTSPPIQSAATRSTPAGRRDAGGGRRRGRAAGPSGGDGSKNSGRATPVSSFSAENSQDRVLGETDNGKPDSDNESSGGQKPSHLRLPHNHSTTVTFSNNKHGKDLRELSKTNVANRKRAREKSDSPPDQNDKKCKLECSSLSLNSSQHEKVNGFVKSGKKGLLGLDRTAGTPTAACKRVSSPAMSDSHPSLSQNDSLTRQDSSQSIDRPLRDKHKVKTTEQLIEDLQKKNKNSTVGNTLINKLRTNQIEKESDLPGSALPVGMRAKGKRGRGRGRNQDVNLSVPSSDAMLTRTKTELVERFLQTSLDPAPPGDEDHPFRDDLLGDASHPPKLGLGACSSSYSKDNFDVSFSASRQDRSESAPKDESSLDATSPPLSGPSTSQAERSGSALTLQEIYAQLPPIDDDIDWDAVDFYQLPERGPVTDESVERLHSERVPGVNGLYDMNEDWTRWREMVTLQGHDNLPLHILPYVDLDG